MSRTIELSDESLDLLKQQALAHGLSVEEWIEQLARKSAGVDNAGVDKETPLPSKARAAVTQILDIQKRVKPDPRGWTIRDYIDHGRR